MRVISRVGLVYASELLHKTRADWTPISEKGYYDDKRSKGSILMELNAEKSRQ